MGIPPGGVWLRLLQMTYGEWSQCKGSVVCNLPLYGYFFKKFILLQYIQLISTPETVAIQNTIHSNAATGCTALPSCPDGNVSYPVWHSLYTIILQKTDSTSDFHPPRFLTP
jgi:hypothetical protein